MPDRKKKHEKEDSEPQEEHFTIDFDRIFLMCRIKFGMNQHDAELLTFGKWGDIFHAFKEIYNFETKGSLYPDIEKELKQYQAEHQPVTPLSKI